MSEMPRVLVLWGIPSHKCSTCGETFEWGGREAPTAEMLSVCPKCEDGPLVELSPDERAALTDRGGPK